MIRRLYLHILSVGLKVGQTFSAGFTLISKLLGNFGDDISVIYFKICSKSAEYGHGNQHAVELI